MSRFEDWWEQAKDSQECIARSYDEGFKAGAASRDAEVATLRELKQIYQTERDQSRRTAEYWKSNHLAGNQAIDQLREQVAMLRESVKNLINAKGRYNTEIAHQQGMDTLAATETNE